MLGSYAFWIKLLLVGSAMAVNWQSKSLGPTVHVCYVFGFVCKLGKIFSHDCFLFHQKLRRHRLQRTRPLVDIFIPTLQ
jgi:hypothetical protein